MRGRFAFGTTTVAGLLLAMPASAAFHLMKIVEVFPGTAAAPDAQYVMLQMYSGGQNLVGGHAVEVFDAAGNSIQQFTFGGNVANGSNQSTILIATAEAEAFFSVAADLSMTAVVASAGGKICFDASPIDCFSWGDYAGPDTGTGTPFQVSMGLHSGEAVLRRLDISGAPDTLEAGDDTDDSANDFFADLPIPRNNAGLLGTIPAADCGNDELEGLEECDDGGTDPGDGCSKLCLLEDLEPEVFADGFEGDDVP